MKGDMAMVVFLFIFLNILREVTIGRNMDNFSIYIHSYSIILFSAINFSVCAFHLHQVVDNKKDDENTNQHKGLSRALCVANIMSILKYAIATVWYRLYVCQQNPSATSFSCIQSVYSSLIGQIADQLNLVSFCCAPSLSTCEPTVLHSCIHADYVYIPLGFHHLPPRTGS